MYLQKSYLVLEEEVLTLVNAPYASTVISHLSMYLDSDVFMCT